MSKVRTINLAICSQRQTAYSETFIQAHRNIPGTKALYYYGGKPPVVEDGRGHVLSPHPVKKIWRKLRRCVYAGELTELEQGLARSFRRNAVECVLAEYGPTGVALLPVCRALEIPLVVHFHGFDATTRRILERYGARGYPELFSYAACIVVVSRVMRQRVLALGCPPEKVVRTVCGAHRRFLSIEPTYSTKALVAVGRFVDKKAPYYTILAFKQALARHPDARLIMAGDGELRNVCQNLVRYLGIEEQVDLVGAISPEAVVRLFQGARAFVQHSITALSGDMEGTPVSVLEASAAGLPIISTRHAGIPDVVDDGRTGLLVEEHDVAGMAMHMARFLDDIGFARQLGQAGKIHVGANFTLEKHLETLGNAIRHAVSVRPRQNPLFTGKGARRMV